MWFNKKYILEYLLIIIVFGLSCINPTLLYISLFLSLFYLFQGKIGIVKLEFLLIMRTIISPGILFDINEVPIFQYFKWLIIFGGSIYLIVFSKRFNYNVSLLIIIYTIFIFYLIFSTIFFSSNPLLGIFKIINYALPLFSLYLNKDYLVKKNIDKWIKNIMIIFIVFSVVLIFFPLGYLRNQHGFQGITNNPNMFGIIMVLAYTFMIKSKINLFSFATITMLFIYLIYISESRTSLVSILVLIIVYSLMEKRLVKVLLILSPILVIVIITIISNVNIIDKLLRKGGSDVDILYSRTGQIETTKYAFYNSPIFGNGFGVPFSPFGMSNKEQTIVEAGNLFLAIIMYSGIIGLALFSFLLIYWSFKVKKEYLLIFLGVFLINMGEMVLFSSNSIGLWCSLIWVISLKKFDEVL